MKKIKLFIKKFMDGNTLTIIKKHPYLSNWNKKYQLGVVEIGLMDLK